MYQFDLMKYLIFLFLLISIQSCNGQKIFKPGDIFFEEIGWTINFPDDLKFQNKQQIDSLIAVTLKRTKIKTSLPVKDLPGKTLFSILDGYNGFNSTMDKTNKRVFKSWRERHLADKADILKTLNAGKGNFEIRDTSTSKHVIGGVEFERFAFTIFSPARKINMQTYWYAAEVNNYNVSINISYTDEEKGKRFRDILQASSFEK